MYGKKILKAQVYLLPDQSFSYNNRLQDSNCNIVDKKVTFDKNSGGYSVYLEWEQDAEYTFTNEEIGGEETI